MPEMTESQLANYLADMLEQFTHLADKLNDEFFADVLQLAAKMARRIETQRKERT